IFANHPKPAGSVLRGNVTAERGPLEGTDDPLQMQCGDDVLVSLTHQRRQDLAVSRKIAEMTDGFASQVSVVLQGSKNISHAANRRVVGGERCGFDSRDWLGDSGEPHKMEPSFQV